MKEAQELIHEIPEASVLVFASLLRACRNHSDYSSGEEVAKKLSELDPQDPAPFMIFVGVTLRQSVSKVKIMESGGIKSFVDFDL